MQVHPPNEDFCPIERLVPYANNARTHSKKQVKQFAERIRRFGFCDPVLISDDNTIVAGHGRVEAAKLIGMGDVPVRRLSHLSRDEVRAYILVDNKLAENAGWDRDLLAIEMQGLMDLYSDIEDLGFSTEEIDLTIAGVQTCASAKDSDLDCVEPVASGPAVTQSGDLWLLGQHRLLCGDARSKEDVSRLCGDRPASLLFTDPPYNVPIDGHVSGFVNRMRGRRCRQVFAIDVRKLRGTHKSICFTFSATVMPSCLLFSTLK